MPSSTRATSCTRTARPPPRTRSAGSSASSLPGRTARPTVRRPGRCRPSASWTAADRPARRQAPVPPGPVAAESSSPGPMASSIPSSRLEVGGQLDDRLGRGRRAGDRRARRAARPARPGGSRRVVAFALPAGGDERDASVAEGDDVAGRVVRERRAVSGVVARDLRMGARPVRRSSSCGCGSRTRRTGPSPVRPGMTWCVARSPRCTRSSQPTAERSSR